MNRLSDQNVSGDDTMDFREELRYLTGITPKIMGYKKPPKKDPISRIDEIIKSKQSPGISKNGTNNFHKAEQDCFDPDLKDY